MNRLTFSLGIGVLSAAIGMIPVSGEQNLQGQTPVLAASNGTYQGKTLSNWISDLEKKQASAVVQNRTRWYAAYALGQMGPQATSAADALIDRLNEIGEYEYVRSACAWALGRIQSPQAIPVLSANLGSRLASVRKECAMALGDFGPQAQSSIPALKALLSETISQDSAQENTEEPPAADSVAITPETAEPEREPTERARAAAAIWKIAGDESPEANEGKQTLKKMLLSNSGRNRLAVLTELKRLPEDFDLSGYYSPLAMLAQKSNNEDVARESARILAARGQLESAEKAITSEESLIRLRGLRLLSFSEQKPPVEKIVPLALNDPDPQVRAWSVRVLGKAIENPEAENAILKAVDDENPDVKRAARKALNK